ncbi:MAG: SpoIIE family protein phosphatase [Desulfobacterales bacterium]|nr:SpoIIE family protein phosphatase [Desulfobacterales bacterium]
MSERKHKQQVNDKFTFADESEDDKFTFADERKDDKLTFADERKGDDKLTFADESEDDKLTFADEYKGDRFTFRDESEDDPVFADEVSDEMPACNEEDTWIVMIVDDEKAVHDTTVRVLEDFSFEGRELHFLNAYSGEEAKEMIKECPGTAVILLDVVMETDHAGLEVVRYIRNELNNDIVQIILRTGQPGQAPEHKVIAEYSINDYKSKTELTVQKLFTTITTSLRAYRITEKLKQEMAERKKLYLMHMKAETKAKLLAHEMKLAKNIQSSLIPSKPRLPGYDIAASIEPTDEVGGDYYDIISLDNCNRFIIGDVSGHGVPAGLVMMMVQTAIHTTLLENPKVEPDRLLAIVNRTIYQNIEKLGESKHMTMVVLIADKDGNFTFSGLHEDILIRRADTGKVETIETRGMWLGIEPDIADMLHVDNFRMEPGDIMVLFTDGITEAMDKTGDMFGHNRLTKVIEESGNKSASETHNNIINALEPWYKDDDVTLVVVKRTE